MTVHTFIILWMLFSVSAITVFYVRYRMLAAELKMLRDKRKRKDET